MLPLLTGGAFHPSGHQCDRLEDGDDIRVQAVWNPQFIPEATQTHITEQPPGLILLLF